MAFTFTNYAAIRPQQSPMHDILGQILGGYTDMTKARYLQPGLEEELKKAKLYNQYYGPNIESQIGLRGAQAGQARAHTGLLGEQTRGEHFRNQTLPQMLQAELEAKKMAGAKAALFNQMMQRDLAAQQGQPTQSNQMQIPGNYSPGQGMGMFQGEQIPQSSGFQQPDINQQIQQQMGQQSGRGYQEANIRPNMADWYNKQMYGVDTFTPRLKEQLDMANREQKAFKTELGKADAKKIAGLEDIILDKGGMGDNLNSMNEMLGGDAFAALRQHPVLGKHELGWYKKFGTKEQQDMVGQAQTYMGNIIKASARDFPGQFRIGEQALLNSMKPSESDSLDVMKGKAEALTFLHNIMVKRAELEANYMRQGATAQQARMISDKQIDPKKIKEDIRTVLHPATSKASSFNQADLEYTAKKHNMTVEEVRQKLGAR